MRALWDGIKTNPIAATSIVAALVALPNLDKGLDILTRWYRTPSVAEAAMQKATETDQEFEAYLQQQREALKVQAAYTQAQNEFNELLMQQQQMPNAPPAPPSRYWHADSQRYYCCAADDPACTNWWWCS